MIVVENKKLHDLIIEKDKLVDVGRGFTREIEDIDLKIKRYEEKEKQITKKINPPQELIDEGEALVKKVTELNVKLTKIAEQINQSKLDAIPEEMKQKHMDLLKDKEKKERERNKVALKIQKIKDKIIPIVQKEVKPLLGEYDDIETAKAKDGKVTITTFNHLTDFKAKFRR